MAGGSLAGKDCAPHSSTMSQSGLGVSASVTGGVTVMAPVCWPGSPPAACRAAGRAGALEGGMRAITNSDRPPRAARGVEEHDR